MTGYANIYEVLTSSGSSKNPKEFLYSTTAPVDGSKPPEKSAKAYQKDTAYYISILEGSGIFLSIKSDGNVDMTKAIWWGADKTFNTSDDVDTAVKETGGYYYWQEAEGVWKTITGILNPEKTTTVNPSSDTTTAPGASSSGTTTAPGGYSSSTNGFFTTGEHVYPKTGLPVRTGLIVCMALLFMGCLYCGFQAIRKKSAAR